MTTIDHIAQFPCVILRGLPGTGKSTFAARLVRDFGFVRLEADDHFMVNGDYRFDPARLADAHALVVREALAHLQAGRRVAVANTHVRLWEMAGIVGACELATNRFCVVECVGAWPNLHSVPEAVVAQMKQRWEAWPVRHTAAVFRLPPDGSTLDCLSA